MRYQVALEPGKPTVAYRSLDDVPAYRPDLRVWTIEAPTATAAIDAVACLRPLHPDVLLASGRIIRHTYLHNGAQAATPTTGAEEMTNAEWIEYCHHVTGI